MSYDIKVIDEKSLLYGKKLIGAIIYYDINHTGDSPDLLFAQDEEDKIYRLLSNQIDEDYYHEQEKDSEIRRLGANVGDRVIIIKSGSGYSKRDFDPKEPHVITKIDYTGHVEFDSGMGSMFRPTIKII